MHTKLLYLQIMFRNFFILTICLCIAAPAFAQKPVKQFNYKDFSAADSLALLKEFGNNKELIPEFALPTLIALSYYPELKNTPIRFIYKPAHTPLTTRPTVKSIFRKGSNRRFTITVSTQTEPMLEPLLLKHMDFNARIGVIGHELSHVADFSKSSFITFVKSGIGHLSSNYLDKFEFRTDSICIAHGLGYQLLAWSKFVRQTKHTKNWRGADNVHNMPMMKERYMNPETIMKYIASMPNIYNKDSTNAAAIFAVNQVFK